MSVRAVGSTGRSATSGEVYGRREVSPRLLLGLVHGRCGGRWSLSIYRVTRTRCHADQFPAASWACTQTALAAFETIMKLDVLKRVTPSAVDGVRPT